MRMKRRAEYRNALRGPERSGDQVRWRTRDLLTWPSDADPTGIGRSAVPWHVQRARRETAVPGRRKKSARIAVPSLERPSGRSS